MYNSEAVFFKNCLRVNSVCNFFYDFAKKNTNTVVIMSFEKILVRTTRPRSMMLVERLVFGWYLPYDACFLLGVSAPLSRHHTLRDFATQVTTHSIAQNL